MARRINTPNRSLNLFGAGKDGWRAGNQALNINATENSADFMNMVQEEICQVAESAGIALDPNNNAQLLQAIKWLVQNNNFSGLVRSLTPLGGALVREWADSVAATTGNIELGISYNCAVDPVTGVWAGRDVADVCWLEKWSDVGGVKEYWFAPTAAAGVVPAWVKTFAIDPVLGVSASSAPNNTQFSHRNKIINGDMRIDQRNAAAAQTFTAGAALAYSVDRFYGYCTGANITGQQVAGPIANTFRYRFTGAASNTGVGFGTRLEAENTAMMAGAIATLQAKLSSSALGVINWTAYYANTKDTFGSFATPTRTQIATGSFNITAGEAMYSTQINLPAGATTGIEIVFTGGALLAGQTLTIGEVQLEPGSAATPFEHRSKSVELGMCQRYFEKSFQYDVKPANSPTANTLITPYGCYGGYSENYRWSASNTFKMEKRVAPTMSFYGDVNGYWLVNGTGYSTASQSIITMNGFNVSQQSIAGGQFVQGHWTASAEL